MTDTDKNCPHCGVHIDEHPASPCLNAWVAVDVMGWKELGPGVFEYIEEGPFEDCDCISHSQSRHFEPSTDIAPAWEVLDKFQSAEIEREFGGHTRIVLEAAGSGWFSAHAPTTPHAACRAAIKASPKTRINVDPDPRLSLTLATFSSTPKEKEMGHPILVGDSEYRQELLKYRNEVGGNMFGLVLHYDEATSKYTPITCSHGGSGWLCPACAVRIISGGAVERLEKAKTLIQEQAGDEGLWFMPQCATEVYLQNALRKLQAVIEGEE